MIIGTVIIAKVNSGVTFRAEGYRGQLQAAAACGVAIDWYRAQAKQALEANGMGTTGYARLLEVAREVGHGGSWSLPLEPWGFAVNGDMGDSGSTPTAARIKALEAYQAPLLREDREEFVYFGRSLRVKVFPSRAPGWRAEVINPF